MPNISYSIVRVCSTLFAFVSNVGLECIQLNLQLRELSLSSRALALVDGNNYDDDSHQSATTCSRYHHNRPLVLTVRLQPVQLLIFQLTQLEYQVANCHLAKHAYIHGAGCHLGYNSPPGLDSELLVLLTSLVCQ